MKRERLLELIDACRPGSDDHLHGELAELGEEIARDETARQLFEQVQSLDSRLVELFQESQQEIEVPAGLQTRLAAALAEQASNENTEPTPLATAVDAAVEQAVVASDSSVAPAPQPQQGPTRRRFVAVILGSLAAVAAIATLSALLQDDKPQMLTEQQLADRAIAWESQLAADAWQENVAWRVQEMPLPPELRRQPFRWQDWEDPWQGQGVVYDFSPSTAPNSVFLYASAAVDNVTKLPMGPPEKAQSSTGNLSVAVWQWEDEMLYVLVIHGPHDRYRQLVAPSTFAQVTPECPLLLGWAR